jgi:hypothetical protein
MHGFFMYHQSTREAVKFNMEESSGSAGLNGKHGSAE